MPEGIVVASHTILLPYCTFNCFVKTREEAIKVFGTVTTAMAKCGRFLYNEKC